MSDTILGGPVRTLIIRNLGSRPSLDKLANPDPEKQMEPPKKPPSFPNVVRASFWVIPCHGSLRGSGDVVAA